METFNSLFMVSPLLLGVLFFVAMLAGFIDSIAGMVSNPPPPAI
ncbi:hypothetical protein MLX36_01180, partial [Escherichia coli]|nr:hypothetical protein [Escherichia coli]